MEKKKDTFRIFWIIILTIQGQFPCWLRPIGAEVQNPLKSTHLPIAVTSFLSVH